MVLLAYDRYASAAKSRLTNGQRNSGIESAMNILEKIKDFHDRVFDAVIDGARKLVGKPADKLATLPVRVDPSDKQPPPGCRP